MMAWLASLLTALALIQAGAGFCPEAGASGGMAGAASAVAHHEQAGSGSEMPYEHVHHHQPDHASAATPAEHAHAEAGCEAACGGGVSCGECAVIVALGTLDTDASSGHGVLPPRVFAHAQAPRPQFSFEPPPPKA